MTGRILTATVPKIAPLAPTDGEATNAKLAPSTFLNGVLADLNTRIRLIAPTRRSQQQNTKQRTEENPFPARLGLTPSAVQAC